MPWAGSTIPRRFGTARRSGATNGPSELLVKAARLDAASVLSDLKSGPAGLTQEEAELRLERHGPNVVAKDEGAGRVKLLLKALVNPLVVLLSLLATISLLTGDARAAIVMAAMVVLGVSLRFVQESRADTAAKKLRAMIKVMATVLRDGKPRDVPLADLVPGDVVTLCAGDMFPADVRLLAAKDLFVIQATLTGESMPVEKVDVPEPPDRTSALELRNIGFLGTSVETGTGAAVVVSTGERTYLGALARAVVGEQVQTAFDKGVARFTWLMIRFILVMVPLVFVINGLTKGNWREAFFFALAVAVGMTPEMLPMIVTVCLTKGALLMARKKVIVKRLHSIQNLGAMDVLCTDKTGTLTAGQVVLEKHCDVELQEDDEVLVLAYLNSHFQTGLKNLLDRAILAHTGVNERIRIPDHRKVDEIPFDFSRRLMSVVVERPDGTHRLICKGAPEEVFRRCTQFEYGGEQLPMERVLLEDLRLEHDKLSADGFRVLAIAYRDFAPKATYSKADEAELVLRGYAAFFDPPKDSARPALEALYGHGVGTKVLTGDSDAVSKKICRDVGIPVGRVLLGHEVEAMTDAELEVAAEEVTLFARLAPNHKQRIVKALQRRGHVVGFLGDGINDGPALRAADVGISVDSAVDIAKESADLILLEMSLMVLEEGILEGRKVFANILKYIRMGASSSFGNMFSVVGASAFLPFVPMAPLQILTNNLLYDFSQVPIPTDNVDPEQIARPRPWSMEQITRFILFIGPCSSVFDYSTYLLMLLVFQANEPSRASLFQTGWFVESLLTQTLIIHVIRTNGVPFIQSRASMQLTLTSALIMAVGVWLPFSPFASALGFTALPPLYWPLVVATLFLYVLLTQAVKMWLLRRAWI
ncbi:MAG TPA: magnesium-translocating P-type ATPase [Anaeromyxobacteraceae bacterium]|nr:magnesium-translocating P-type ATPase [Anaeromyxobacteraceae bacterium]